MKWLTTLLCRLIKKGFSERETLRQEEKEGKARAVRIAGDRLPERKNRPALLREGRVSLD